MKQSTPVRLTALLLALTPVAFSQAHPTQRPPDGGTREVLVSILLPSLPNAPFSAIVSTESIRQLADGTTITLKNRRAIARDSAGRIFQERRLLVPDDGKHESPITQIEISDPVAHDLYICVPREDVCQVETFSTPAFMPPRIADESQKGAGNLESLGKQSINGLDTIGTRETSVIEAGALGNSSPIEVKREYWYSPHLGVNLISRLQDPRVGIQTFEVSEIALTEPDPNLFKTPRNAKLIDLRNAAKHSALAVSN